MRTKTHKLILILLLAILFPLRSWCGKNIILKTPEEYQILSISPNGKWACGNYNDYAYASYGFRWNLVSGEIEMLSTATESTASGIADDGTVAGSITTSIGNEAPRELPAFYSNGEWHIVDFPQGTILQGVGYDITPDGHYMSGSLVVDNHYNSYIWKDGAIYRALETSPSPSMPYCIAPDGQGAGGWIDTDNRQACYWTPAGTTEFLSDYKSPWSSARSFSPDGKKLLFWGGWNSEEEAVARLLCLLDIESGKKTSLIPMNNSDSFELFDLSNNGVIVGESGGRGFVYDNGVSTYADKYLENKGVDLKDLDMYIMEGTDFYQLIRAQAINADASVMGVLIYANAGDNQAALRSVIIKFDCDVTNAAPPVLRVSQLDDIKGTKLSWGAPLGAEGITGYNIYRNNVKIATVGSEARSYVDTGLSAQSYVYSISAIYGTVETERTASEPITVEEHKIQAPQSLTARQKGYNNAYISWLTPKSNLITKTYTDINTANIQGFGPNSDDMPFEIAIRYDADEVKAYAGNKITKVLFYPLSEQKDWTINLYTYEGNTLKLFYSQPVTQTLEYDKLNSVTLDTPQSLPSGELVIGVSVNVPYASSNVFAMDYGKADMRYSDLVRLVGESDFYSLSEMSSANGIMYRASWLLSAILSPDDASADTDNLNGYDVFADGEKVATTPNTSIVLPALSEGTHKIGVTASFATGDVSEQVKSSVVIKNNPAALPPVDDVAVNFTSATEMTATWNHPKDIDARSISYCGETPNVYSLTPPDGYNMIQFASEYPSSMFKGYQGYNIKTARFYPLSDAIFTIYIYEGNKLIAEQEVESVNVGQWNTVTFDNPVSIKEGFSYRIVIDCFDITPGEYIIAVDCNPVYAGYSDLYSLDGESFSSYSYDSAVFNNIMMGITIEDKNGVTADVKGYDFSIDGIQQNSVMLTEPKFTYKFLRADTKQHKLNVDTYYEALSTSVKGGNVIFTIGTSSDIADNRIADIKICQENSFIKVSGENVGRVSVVTSDGIEAAAADSGSVAISNLPAGVYVVKANVNGKETKRKIRITK